MKLAKAAFLFTVASVAVWAQVNAGEQKPEASLPFTMTTVTTFRTALATRLPARRPHADHRKARPRLAGVPAGREDPGGQYARRLFARVRTACMGVFVSPHYATDHNIYLTYAEPGDYGGGLALARAKLTRSPPLQLDLEHFKVLWRQMPKGKGGQEGAQIAFSPDGKYLFLSVGERQRFTPAQDPNQPEGKILRLTLDGKPAPGNPNYGKPGARHYSTDRSAQRHRSRQNRASGEQLYFPWSQPDAG